MPKTTMVSSTISMGMMIWLHYDFLLPFSWYSKRYTVFIFGTRFKCSRFDSGPLEKAGRIQGRTALRRWPICESGNRPHMLDTTGHRRSWWYHLQSKNHRFHKMRRSQTKRKPCKIEKLVHTKTSISISSFLIGFCTRSNLVSTISWRCNAIWPRADHHV